MTIKTTDITDLIQAFKSIDVNYKQVNAAELLGKSANKDAIPPLIDVLMSSDDWTVQIAILESLAQLDAQSATSQIAELYNDQHLSIEVRGKAIEALSSINYQEYRQLIKDAFWYDGRFSERIVFPAALALIKNEVINEILLYPDPVYFDDKIKVVFDRGRSSSRKHSTKYYRHAYITNFTNHRVRVFGQHFSDSEIETVSSGKEDWLPISYAFTNNSEYGYVDNRADQFGCFYVFFSDGLDEKSEIDESKGDKSNFPIKSAIVQFKFDIECYRE